MIRPPNIDDEGTLTDDDYLLMVGLTNTLPNPPNYPTAKSMSSLLRHDVVLIDDVHGAFLSSHRNEDRKAIIARYMLPVDIRQTVAWRLGKATFAEIERRWPDTLDWVYIAPFTENPDPRRVAETWELFFSRWPVASERPRAIDDDDIGWSIYWPKLRYILAQSRSPVFDGP